MALLFPAQIAWASTAPTSINVAMVVPTTMQLYPLTMMDRDGLSLMNLVYEGLFVLDDDRAPQPSLVEKWEMLSDGRTWLFTIRSGVYFHDGRELKASDVSATMDAINRIASDTSLADNEKGLYCLFPNLWKRWGADDDYTLRVQTDRPYYGLLYSLTFPVLQAQSLYNENPPGTGPYRVDYYAPGSELWLSVNANWWSQRAHVEEIVAKWYANEADALAAFEAEEVDVMMTRDTSAVRYRGTVSSRINSYNYSTRQLECLLINHSLNTLGGSDKLKMRQAITYAINKNRLITGVYQGIVTATETVQSTQSFLYNHDVKTYGYNPELAMSLLDEEGWNLIDEEGYRYKKTESGEPKLVLRLFYYDEAGNALRKEAANEIATMLRAVGIRVSVHPYTFENAQAKLNAGDFDLLLCAYNFDVVPDPTFLLGSGNLSRYRSEAMGKLLSGLRTSMDKIGLEASWMQIQDQMAADVPFVPLYWRNGVVLTRYPYSSIRDIREFEILRSIELYR